MKTVLLILALSFLLADGSLSAQVSDSTSKLNDSISKAKVARKKIYSAPRRASILSAVLPGLGQVYNRKYWKVPIIYAGLGGFSYMFYTNNTQYNDYRKALRTSVSNSNMPVYVYNRTYSQDQLQKQKLYYRKYRDFAMIGIGIIYLVNIVDANVDAHLKTFDVSNDLSIQIDPWQTIFNTDLGCRTATGLSIKINFK